MATPTPQEPTGAQGSGVMGNLSRIKRDSSYTLAELQAFLAEMRGRSPQEVLGMVSTSELVRGIALATVGCVVLIGVLTVVPYALRDTTAAATKPADAETQAPAATSETTAASTTAPVVADGDTKKQPSEADLGAAAKALNIDEVKTADPSINPLDKDLNKLLDGKE